MTNEVTRRAPPGDGSERGEGASAEPALTAQDWLMRLLPLVLLVLLIVAGLAGLRGAAGAPRWDGPLNTEPPARRRPEDRMARRIWRMEQEAIRFSLRELGVPVVHWNGEESLDLPLAAHTRRPMAARR